LTCHQIFWRSDRFQGTRLLLWWSTSRFLAGNPKGKQSLGRSRRGWGGHYGNGMTWTGLIWLRIGRVAYSCENGHETLQSIKCGAFLGWQSSCWLVKKDCAMQLVAPLAFFTVWFEQWQSDRTKLFAVRTGEIVLAAVSVKVTGF